MAGRKRKCGQKVRTGCITCKIRRLKCDEGKPACRNCTSTGRTCDGYEFIRSENGVLKRVTLQNPNRRSVVPELFVPPPRATISQSFDGTVQERRIFYRFRLRSIPAFAGISEREFWNNLVVQAATQEPVIRDAVIALGTLHEEFELGNGEYDQTVEQHSHYRNATVLYGKALRQLRKRIDRSPGETAKLAIIASVLFTCFETLRRNNMAAIVHYQAGMRELIRQMKTRQQQPDSANKPRLRDIPEDDMDRMLRVFARLDIQACTFAKPKVEALDLEALGGPPEIISLVEARSNLENLLITIYQLVKSEHAIYRYWSATEVSPNWHKTRHEALNCFRDWIYAIENSIPSDAAALTACEVTDSRCLLGLLLQVKIAFIMLQTSIDCGHETTFDAFYDDFEDMLTRVEGLTEALGFTESEPLGIDNTPFTMELGLVHPLFFVACKCRDWDLRRRAIIQLRKAGKEGVWEGPIMAVVASRVATQEEQGLQYGDFVPEVVRVHEVWQEVCYEERLVRTVMKIAQDETWEHWKVIREGVPF